MKNLILSFLAIFFVSVFSANAQSKDKVIKNPCECGEIGIPEYTCQIVSGTFKVNNVQVQYTLKVTIDYINENFVGFEGDYSYTTGGISLPAVFPISGTFMDSNGFITGINYSGFPAGIAGQPWFKQGLIQSLNSQLAFGSAW
ncbi:hypothetical protein [Aureivirga sp. CE67]|uniref:hypothetical protein n=1 Tax=Aureivirga sp. CE67 TaxID=1788983 RepID=UPI0018C99096|nr:hypothetical protein [Aureivirga sp. CE67]